MNTDTGFAFHEAITFQMTLSTYNIKRLQQNHVISTEESSTPKSEKPGSFHS